MQRVGVAAQVWYSHERDLIPCGKEASYSMPLTEKDRKRRRRQRRRVKLHELKRKYADTNDPKRRRELEEKIRKLQPWWEPTES